MNQWIITSRKTQFKPDFNYDYKFKTSSFSLWIKSNNPQSFINSTQSEGIFVFGKLIPRLQANINGLNYQEILYRIKDEGVDYINNFKGNFIIIAIFDDNLHLFNDQFGINKYFFYGSDADFIASNELTFLKSHCPLNISRKNILKYYIFNYFTNGETIYTDLNYSTGGSYHKLGKIPSHRKYFEILQFLDQKSIVYNRKKGITEAAKNWSSILHQYLEIFKGESISQTLTAGMDSRLILAGLRANNYTPSTFTFGHSENLDVIHARKVSKQLNIPHTHIYPNKEFFQNYHIHAKEVIKKSSGMSTIYRAHRLHAYKTIANSSNVIFFGFIGSEIIRGLYPDKLLVPQIFIDYWLNGTINLYDYLPPNWFHVSEKEITDIKEDILAEGVLERPDLLLFKLMIPLHFAQDIALNESLGVVSIAPFWDIDFLNFLKQTPFFIDNNRKHEFAKLGHYSRSKGPYFSSKLISILDRENAKMSLGKGYSPADYSKSRYYAAAKFTYYKTLHRKRYTSPNFDYSEWYNEFLKCFIEKHNFSFLDIDKNQMYKYLENNSGTDEYSFLHITKAINIQLISEYL